MSSLRAFLNSLHPEEVLRVTEAVDADYFSTALVHELERQKRYPVVLIERPGPFDIPIVANVFADAGRLAKIVGISLDEFRRTPWFRQAETHSMPPRMVDDGPVREVVLTGDDVDVTALPIVRHHEQDAGAYVTSGVLVSRDPDDKTRNLSFSRLMLKGRNRFGMSLHSRGHPWNYQQRAEARGEDLEVAFVIGAHPTLYLGAAAKVGMDVDEYDLAGGFLRQPFELVACETVDLEVPAEAEIVLEGRVLAGVYEPEGPFGEYTGYATGNSTRNVFEVTAITRRAEPLYQDIIPSTVEHRMLGSSSKRAHVLGRLQEVIPTITALNYPQSGTYYNAYLSMKKAADGQAQHAAMLLLGLDAYVKHAIVVDDDIDVFDEEQVMWAVATRVQADRDVFIVPNMICNKLDPSAVDGKSAKMGIDATAPLNWGVQAVTSPGPVADAARSYLARHGR